MDRVREWIDSGAGVLIASFFAIPALRSATGIGQAAYFAVTILIVGVAAYKLLASTTRKLGRYELWFVGSSLLLFAWLLISVFWTVSNAQYVKDAVLVLGLAALVATIPFVISENTLKAALATVVTVGVAVGAYVLYSYATVESLAGYDVVFGDYYLTVAQSIGAAAVGLTVYTVFCERRRWWHFASILFLFIALALALARGALLFALVVVTLSLFYALFREPLQRSSVAGYLKSVGGRTAGALAIVGAGTGVIAVALVVERTARRLMRLLGGGGASVGLRLQWWRTSWENISQAPVLGYGLGSNGMMAGATESLYPHNFLLQVWLDGGILALLLTVVAVGVPLAAFFRSGRTSSALQLSLLGVYVFMILEHSKSYNFYTGRLLFIFGMLCLSAFAIQSEK